MSLGRPLEFDPETALDAAMEVFWRHGFEATSLQDLLTAMNLSKSSFYQAFGSKQQLFETCLTRFRERQAARMMHTLATAPTGLSFLRQFLRSVAKEARAADCPKGCLIMNTATEFAGRDSAVASLVEQGVSAFSEVFHAAVTRAQREGDIAAERNAEALARYIVSTVSGIKTMIKAGASAKTAEEIAEVALTALH